MDFVTEPEESRVAINGWVSGQTEQRIEELIPQGLINDLTRLILVNTIYFNASWAKPFDAANTKDEAFTLLDGSEISTPAMHAGVETTYAAGANYQAAELYYDGGQLAMLLIVPNEGEFAAVESSLSANRGRADPKRAQRASGDFVVAEVQVSLAGAGQGAAHGARHGRGIRYRRRPLGHDGQARLRHSRRGA
jgi:serpin B